MEYRFSINKILNKRINKITHTLIPEGFRGDRREYNDCQRILTRILDDIGEASAKAQGLNRIITSALKLRDTDHIIYLMVDHEGNNGLGCVIGLLKTGFKSLFMFDENGYHYQLKPRCILDFYIHETRQRKGLGLELYQYMLAEENLQPIKLAIDRPSDKFLAFLMKHYGFSSVIPQNNKFVVFKGFFDDEVEFSRISNRFSDPSITSQQENKNQSNSYHEAYAKNESVNGKPVTRSAYGRYAASRPPCSMADIIHNTTTIEQPAEHNTRAFSAMPSLGLKERPDSLNFYKDKLVNLTLDDNLSRNQNFEDSMNQPFQQDIKNTQKTAGIYNDEVDTIVLPDPEICDEKPAEEIVTNENLANPNNMCNHQETECTEQQSGVGHLDLKFYHSPLW